jgi:hypothetical protein
MNPRVGADVGVLDVPSVKDYGVIIGDGAAAPYLIAVVVHQGVKIILNKAIPWTIQDKLGQFKAEVCEDANWAAADFYPNGDLNAVTVAAIAAGAQGGVGDYGFSPGLKTLEQWAAVYCRSASDAGVNEGGKIDPLGQGE